jgi:hypothetical protein
MIGDLPGVIQIRRLGVIPAPISANLVVIQSYLDKTRHCPLVGIREEIYTLVSKKA